MVADTVPVQPLRVVLGVGGGIAAYKACLLSRLFSESGADVTVVPTEAALHFVGAATWEALSGHPVSTSVWDGVDAVSYTHLDVYKRQDCAVARVCCRPRSESLPKPRRGPVERTTRQVNAGATVARDRRFR